MSVGKVHESTSDQAQTYYKGILDGAYQRSLGAKNHRIVPHPNTLFVKPDSAEQKTPGGLHIPEKAQETKTTGTVVAAREDDTYYSVGDRVIFRNQGPGQTLEVDGLGKVVILQYCGSIDDDILAKLEPLSG